MTVRYFGSTFAASTELSDQYDSVFEWAGSDIFSFVTIFPRVRFGFYIADAAASKEITQSRARWPKAIAQYAIVNFFGRNIVATEGDEWKKHRKIANPAFSEV